jgi:hypothetical protein
MKLLFDVPKSLNNPARLRRYLRMSQAHGAHPNTLRLLRRNFARGAQRLPRYVRIERGAEF